MNKIKINTKKLLQNHPKILNFLIMAYQIKDVIKNLIFLNYSFIKEIITGKKQIITKIGASYFGDGFATTHYVRFLNEDLFVESHRNAWNKVPDIYAWEGKEFNIAWRAHIVTWAASQALRLEGDFVECGVWYGVLSKTICNYIDFANLNRKFYLFDSWGKTPGSHENQNYDQDIYNIVQDRFSEYKNVYLIRGIVPETLANVDIQKIAYLAIDMNGHLAERATLEKYYDKVVPGGIIYFDDYGWGYPELVNTVEDFFENKPESLLHFPSGNSIVIKL